MTKALLASSLLTILAATSAMAQEKPKVDVVHWLTAGAESAAIKVLADEVTARGGEWIDSAAPGGGGDASALMMSRIAGGNPPGVAFLGMGPSALELGDQGALRDVTDIATANGLDKVAQVMIDISTSTDGKLYALPIGLETQNLMWFSPKVFADVGIEPPKTWAEFLTQAEAIKAKGYIPMATGAQGWQLGILFSSVLLDAGGADFYRSVVMEHDEALAAGPEMVAAFTTLRGLADNSDPGSANRAWNDTLNLVAENKAAVQVMGSWAGAELENMGLEQGTAWDCALTPGSDAVIVEGAGFEFPIVSSEAELAGQDLFIQVMMDPKVQTEFARLKGAVPPRSDADSSGLSSCTQMAADALANPEEGGVATMGASLSSDNWGQTQDFLANFWADTSVTPEAAAEQFAAIITTEE